MSRFNPSMNDVAKRAEEIFKETYTAQDILKGNTIEMHQDCWDTAYHMMKLEYTKTVETRYVTLWRDEFKDADIFDQYTTLGYGDVSDDGERVKFKWKPVERIHRELAEKLELMDSDQVFDWVQDQLGGNCAKT